MAAGDLITADWELEYNGLLVGADTDYPVAQISGLLDLPDIKSGDQDRLRRNGLHAGDDFLGGRSVSVTFEVYADTDSEFETAMENLLNATAPGGPEVGLAFQLPGVADGNKAVVFARPRKRSVQMDTSYLYRIPTVLLEFFAVDPRIYSATLSSSSISVAVTSGGLEFDATPDLTFGTTGEGGTFNAKNNGSFPAGALFRVEGPCSNPRIENLTLDRTIELDITLATGEYLLIDTERRTVLLDGTASRYSALTADSEWFDLAAGDNSIKFRASTASGATMTTTWRSAWV